MAAWTNEVQEEDRVREEEVQARTISAQIENPEAGNVHQLTLVDAHAISEDANTYQGSAIVSR